MRKLFLAPLMACLFLPLQSCVSLVTQNKTQFGDEDCSFPPYTYGGTMTSIALIGVTVVEIPKNPVVLISGAMLVVDFPLTVAMDTITLPISAVRDVVACTKRYKENKSAPDEQGELVLSDGIPVFIVLSNTTNERLTFKNYFDSEGI